MKRKALPPPPVQPLQTTIVTLSAEQWAFIQAEQQANREFRESVLNNTGATEKPVGVKEAAAHLGIAKKTLYEYMQNREIKFYNPRGRLRYFYRSELNEWVKKGRKS